MQIFSHAETIQSFLGFPVAVSSVATLVRGGLVFPVAAGLGAVVGAGGAGWNVLESKKKEEKEKSLKEQIKQIIFEEDKVLQEKVRHQIERFEILDETKRYATGEQIKGIIRLWGGVTLNVGPNPAITLAAALVPLSTLFTGIRYFPPFRYQNMYHNSLIGDGPILKVVRRRLVRALVLQYEQQNQPVSCGSLGRNSMRTILQKVMTM